MTIPIKPTISKQAPFHNWTLGRPLCAIFPHMYYKMKNKRKIHAKFNTIINDNSEAVLTKLGDRKSPLFMGMYQTVL
jgi:hypothetical protein